MADGKNFYQYSLENIITILGASWQENVLIYDGSYTPKPNPQFPKLKLIVFTRKDLSSFVIKLETIDVENLGEYTTELNRFPTVLYIFGFLDKFSKFTAEGFFDLTTATLVGGTYLLQNYYAALVDSFPFGSFLVDTSSLYTNVIIVDWSEYNTNYLSSLTNLPVIANLIGDKLYAMSQDPKNILSLNSWHFVGHSLGAHMVGIIARRIKDRAGSVAIPRVTGLDPAGPIIEFIGIRNVYPRLDKDCGK